MPTYEFCLVVRSAAPTTRATVVETLKRAAGYIYDAGGYIRSMESLGHRALPQKQVKHDELHSEGTYFNMVCDMPVSKLKPVLEECGRDRNILRRAFVALDRQKRPDPVCTWADELKTPAYRPSIQQLILEGRKKPKFTQIYNPKTGLDYYPFKK